MTLLLILIGALLVLGLVCLANLAAEWMDFTDEDLWP